ncbi:MAG TPA: hypothetical protein VGK04_08080 [Thermoanaerobaculia bacterium]
MNIRIEPYAPEHVPAVKSFNERWETRAGSAFRLSERPPATPRSALPREEYLALDDGEVRGSFSLKRQQFWINGQTMEIGNCQLPISEGTFNPAYANLGMVLLRHALSLQKRLFCLGMGSRQNRLPRLLSAMGWKLIDIPFLFRVNHPARFMRNIVPLRRTLPRRLAMDAMAASGAGWLGFRALQARIPESSSVAVETVSEFESWADALWDRCKSDLSLSAVRTSSVLNLLYADPRSIRLKVSRDGVVVGWVVLRDTQMQNHRYFGNLRVATIVDAMAVPDAIPAVVRATSRIAEQRGVDLTISNQGHELWVRSLRHCGFLSGPSNYILAMSPAMAALLEPLATHQSRLHINRGDGDGPLDL